MLNFNQQLLNTFFYEKKVDYGFDMFCRYYNSIFPAPELFVNFLSATNREEQTIYAKQIIKRMCFRKYNSSLFYLYKNLIDLEEKLLIERENVYVPRDHSIHSVNTYLLGIYLYFSFSIFHQQLVSFFSKKNYRDKYSRNQDDNAFLCFLNCWQLFSLNHDIGYPLENLVDENGFLKEKNNYSIIERLNAISKLMIEEFAINDIVFLLGLQIIAENSNIPLDEFLSCKEINFLKIKNIDIDEYVKIESIYSKNIFSFYESAFDKKYIIYKVHELDNGNNYIVFRENNTTNLKCVNFDTQTIEIVCDDMLDETKYFVEYFYPKTKFGEIAKESLKQLDVYTDDVEIAAKVVFSQNSISYSNVHDEATYTEFLYNIYKCVINNLLLKERKATPDYYKNFIQKFNTFILNKISNIKFSPKYDEQIEQNLDYFYCTILDELSNRENKSIYISEFLEDSNSTLTFNLLPIYNHIKSQYSKALKGYENSVFFELSKKGDHVLFKNLKGETKNFYTKFVEDYASLAVTSGLIKRKDDIQKIISYNPNYSLFDHGIASCNLVLETYYKADRIKNYRNWFMFKTDNINIPDNEIICTATYAILVHNLYSSFLNSISNSKSVKHDIIKSPFVYFCLFCDNMQIWDRPYRLNQGKMELEKSTVSARDIAIIPTGNKLCIQCVTLEAEKVVSNYRNMLDDYLKDGSKLINLNVFDK